MFDLLRDLATDYTLRTVALGSLLLGIVSGTMGCFAVLRRQALLGDALAHAALPGICIAYLVTGDRAPLPLLLGAAAAGWLATLLILRIVRTTPLKEDTALALTLGVFFGVGILLLTRIQRGGAASQAGLDTYLFGQAATLVAGRVLVFGAVAVVCLGTLALLYKEFKLVTFDPGFAATLGYDPGRMTALSSLLLMAGIVIGLQTVGVVLMAAMIAGPGTAARQWTDRLGTMLVVAGAIGGLAGTGGALLSVSSAALPTGPAIVLVLAGLVALSLLFGRARGLVWRWRRRRRQGLQPPPPIVFGQELPG